jgi:hypothetical protein
MRSTRNNRRSRRQAPVATPRRRAAVSGPRPNTVGQVRTIDRRQARTVRGRDRRPRAAASIDRSPSVGIELARVLLLVALAALCILVGLPALLELAVRLE